MKHTKFGLKRAAGALTFLLFLAVSQTSAADEGGNSGFLGSDDDYARLQEVKLRSGQKAKRWLSPSLNFANYQQLLIEPMVLYPEPQPTPQVSAEVLEQIQVHLTEALREKVGEFLVVSDEAGQGVLRIQGALTGVTVETEGMKAYEVLPVAAVFGAAKAATGKRDQDVKVFLEVRMLDSVTGELQGMVVREVEGEQLKGKKDVLTMGDLQDNLDSSTDDASDGIASALQH